MNYTLFKQDKLDS